MSVDSKMEATGPLARYRVIELGSVVAAPFCARLLADFGAEVIKVEQTDGDQVRLLGERYEGRSLFAKSIMRNKRLIALNLKSLEGQDIVKELVRDCDILVENFKAGTLEGWGLGYETLKEINPGLILVRISGFGQTGPYREYPGYGVIGEAVSGMRHLIGEPDKPPTRTAFPLTDYITGLYAAFGALMAVVHRQQTGEGQYVDTTLFESSFSFLESFVPSYEKLGTVPNRSGTRLAGHSPNNLYKTKDGRDIQIAAAGPSIFKRFAALIGREELVGGPQDEAGRPAYEDLVDEAAAEWVSEQLLDELESKLHAAGIPAARIYTMADIFNDPHYFAREMLKVVPDAEMGSVTLAGIVPKLSASPGSIRHSGGCIGLDTREVLSELGMVAETLDRLEAEGVIRSATDS